MRLLHVKTLELSRVFTSAIKFDRLWSTGLKHDLLFGIWNMTYYLGFSKLYPDFKAIPLIMLFWYYYSVYKFSVNPVKMMFSVNIYSFYIFIRFVEGFSYSNSIAYMIFCSLMNVEITYYLQTFLMVHEALLTGFALFDVPWTIYWLFLWCLFNLFMF